jgi:hypothetical protein
MMEMKQIIAATITLSFWFLLAMALVSRILLQKHPKQAPNDASTADGSDEQTQKMIRLSSSWKRRFTWKKDRERGYWAPTITGIIKAGEGGSSPSTVFANFHRHTDESSLQALYYVFAEELRSRSVDERSQYPGNLSKFLSSTNRIASGPKRTQSLSYRTKGHGQLNGPPNANRRSQDLSIAELGLAKVLPVKKPPLTLVPMRNGLIEERDVDTSWMKDGQMMESLHGKKSVQVTAAELAALSIVLGSPLLVDAKDNQSPSQKGALNISLICSTAGNDNLQISLRKHKRNTSHLPASGSNFSSVFAKHLAAGSLPYAKTNGIVHGILVNTHTLELVQTGSSLCLQEDYFKTPQTIFLAALPSSTALKFHIATQSVQESQTNPLIDAISMLPFVGGLVPLATVPLVHTIRFVASGGLEAVRLLQRLDALVDRVNRHTPGFDIFGPLYEPHNIALLYRERERLSKITAGTSITDTIADKSSRMHRYTTLLQRLMALITDVTPQDVLTVVQEATKKELEQSYIDATNAYKAGPTQYDPVISHRRSGSYNQSKRLSVQTRSDHSSGASMSTMNSPCSSATSYSPWHLGKQVEQLLKADLPLSIEQVAVVARLVIAAWTWSVESVAWEEGEEGFRVPDLAKMPKNMVFC